MPKLNLYELSNQVLLSLLPAAARQRNLIVNDVPANIYIDSDSELGASVIKGLLSSIINDLQNSCIRVTAKIFDGIIFVNVTDSKEYNNCGVIEGMQDASVVPLYFHNIAA